jgi:hypothetical protein
VQEFQPLLTLCTAQKPRVIRDHFDTARLLAAKMDNFGTSRFSRGESRSGLLNGEAVVGSLFLWLRRALCAVPVSVVLTTPGLAPYILVT